MRRRSDWDIPTLAAGVLSGAPALAVTQAGQDRWVRRAARVGSLAQAIQGAHDKSRMEGAAVLGMALAFALTSAVARRRRLLWGLVPLGVIVIVGAAVDARINHEADWSDDLTSAPALALLWLVCSGLAAPAFTPPSAPHAAARRPRGDGAGVTARWRAG